MRIVHSKNWVTQMNKYTGLAEQKKLETQMLKQQKQMLKTQLQAG